MSLLEVILIPSFRNDELEINEDEANGSYSNECPHLISLIQKAIIIIKHSILISLNWLQLVTYYILYVNRLLVI